MTISTIELQNEIQSTVDSLVSDTDEVDWDEDFLSRSLVLRIRKILVSQGAGDDRSELPHLFDLQAYKLTGKAEESHGDIAFVVTRQTGLGPITGVAFYEAKASIRGDRYPQFKYQQLKRLCTHTPRLSYLFYSKNEGVADSSHWPEVYTSDSLPRFKVRTVDANVLKRYRSPNAALKEYGLTFGYHFVQRVLSGRELDYSRAPEETIKKWLATTRRASAIVVNVAVNDPELPAIETQDVLRIEGYETEQISEASVPPRLT